MKKINSKQKSSKKIFYIAGTVVVVLILLQILIDVTYLNSVIRNHPDRGTIFAQLVTDAVGPLNKPAPVDPATGRVYIPDARLVMPAYTGLGQIEYLYEGAQQSTHSSAEIHVTSSLVLDLAKNKVWLDTSNANASSSLGNFDLASATNSIPSLQACSRGVQAFYSKQNLDGDFVFRGSHMLNNGKTLYVYSESNCKQDMTPVIAEVNKAQSY